MKLLCVKYTIYIMVEDKFQKKNTLYVSLFSFNYLLSFLEKLPNESTLLVARWTQQPL